MYGTGCTGDLWAVSKHKETAEDTVREELEQAVREAGRPVVKVEVEMKGKW